MLAVRQCAVSLGFGKMLLDVEIKDRTGSE
jgi:hypothetical protein